MFAGIKENIGLDSATLNQAISIFDKNVKPFANPPPLKAKNRRGSLATELVKKPPQSAVNKRCSISNPIVSRPNAKASVKPSKPVIDNGDRANVESQVAGAMDWMNFTFKQAMSVGVEETSPCSEDALRILMQKSEDLQTRQAFDALLHCREVVEPLKWISREVDEGQLQLREDRNLFADVGLQQTLCTLVFSYRLPWLRYALEAMTGEKLPMWTEEKKCQRAIKALLFNRFLRDTELYAQYERQKFVSMDSDVVLLEGLRSHFLRNFFRLILLLDMARRKNVLKLPALFVKTSIVKSSNEVLQRFCADFLKSEGDILRHLSSLGFEVCFAQSYVDEFDYTVKTFGLDLRDGVRLCRLVEILTHRQDLGCHLRVPAVSRLQKLYNVGLVLQRLHAIDPVTLPHGKSLDDIINQEVKMIVEGDKDRTLALLWRIMNHFEVKMLVDPSVIYAEASRVRENILQYCDRELAGGRHVNEQCQSNAVIVKGDSSSNSLAQALIVWCNAISLPFDGPPIRNLSTDLADGRVLCQVVSYYHPNVLPNRSIKRSQVIAKIAAAASNASFSSPVPRRSSLARLPGSGVKSLSSAAQRAQDCDRKNFAVLRKACKDIGGIPIILGNYDSNNAPDSKTMIIFLANLFVRLTESARQLKACLTIQRFWRKLRVKKMIRGEAKKRKSKRLSRPRVSLRRLSGQLKDVASTCSAVVTAPTRRSSLSRRRSGRLSDIGVVVALSKNQAASIIQKRVRLALRKRVVATIESISTQQDRIQNAAIEDDAEWDNLEEDDELDPLHVMLGLEGERHEEPTQMNNNSNISIFSLPPEEVSMIGTETSGAELIQQDNIFSDIVDAADEIAVEEAFRAEKDMLDKLLVDESFHAEKVKLDNLILTETLAAEKELLDQKYLEETLQAEREILENRLRQELEEKIAIVRQEFEAATREQLLRTSLLSDQLLQEEREARRQMEARIEAEISARQLMEQKIRHLEEEKEAQFQAALEATNRQEKEIQLRKSSAIRIQSYYRMYLAKKAYGSVRIGAVHLQALFRGIQVRIEYGVLKLTVSIAQALWRKKRQLVLFKKVSGAAIKIQSLWRRKAASIRVQMLRVYKFRLERFMRTVVKLFRHKKMTNCAVLIQCCWRRQRAVRVRKVALRAIVRIQTAYRRHNALSSHFVAQQAIKAIQCMTRMFLARKRRAEIIQSQKLQETLVTMRRRIARRRISRWLKTFLNARRQASAKIVLVRWFRAYRGLWRVRRLIGGFTRLAAFRRSLQLRRRSEGLVAQALSKIKQADSEAKLCPEKKLGRLMRSSMEIVALSNGKNLSFPQLFRSIEIITLATQLSKRCCVEFTEKNVDVPFFVLARSCNRTANQAMLRLALSALLNVCRNSDLITHIANSPEAIDVMLDLLQMFRDKKDVFCLAAELLCRLIAASPSAKLICQKSENFKRLEGIAHIIERKYRLEARVRNVRGGLKTRDMDCSMSLNTSVVGPFETHKPSLASEIIGECRTTPDFLQNDEQITFIRELLRLLQ